MSYLMQYEPGFMALHLESSTLRRSLNKTREIQRQLAAARRKLALFSDEEIKAKNELRRGANKRWRFVHEYECAAGPGWSRLLYENAYGESLLHVIKSPCGLSLAACLRQLKNVSPEIYTRLRAEHCDGGYDCTGSWFTPFNAKFHKRRGKNARWIITFQRWRDV